MLRLYEWETLIECEIRLWDGPWAGEQREENITPPAKNYKENINYTFS